MEELQSLCALFKVADDRWWAFNPDFAPAFAEGKTEEEAERALLANVSTELDLDRSGKAKQLKARGGVEVRLKLLAIPLAKTTE